MSLPVQQPSSTALSARSTSDRCGAQDRWAASMAHELRSPLGAILMSFEELRPVCAADRNALEVLEMIEHASKQMARIIEDVLDLSRFRLGKLACNPAAADLATVFAGAVAATRPLLASRRHRLAVSLPPGIPRVLVQASRLEQVLTNLLNNAAKFTPPGGMIRLASIADGGSAVITVSDNGVGIQPELLTRVFDPYFQTDDPAVPFKRLDAD
jgi:signal transduction histidine kinase